MHKDNGSAPPALDPGSALFLDIDGTLLEIASRPELVAVPPELSGLIARRAAERDGALAVVSGRPLAQIDDLLRPWRGAAAGLHGIERRRADGGLAPAHNESASAIARLRPLLAAFAERAPGLVFEDKGATLALHCRLAPQRAAEAVAFARRLQRGAENAVRLIEGKMVVELVPLQAGKGAAIASFLAEPPFLGRRPMFIGDDVTDEDGFRVVNQRGGVAVRVGPRDNTAAKYRLPSVAAVLAWLAAGGNL